MNTCGFCGSELDGNHCNYCEMKLEERYILKDGKRLNQKDFIYPDRSGIYKSTKELMKLETIELFCLLREARAARSEAYELRKLRHQAERQDGSNDIIIDLEKQTYKVYEDATRKVWVIENIIKDRLGYYPPKVTDNFLMMHLDKIEKSEEKEMVMKG